MEETRYHDLLRRLAVPDEHVHIVELDDEELANLTPEQAGELVARYGSTSLITLPKGERDYFDWLRAEDPTIWADLWGSEDQPYLISLGHLPELLPNRRGFPICDLVDNPNYFFTTDDIAPEEGSAFCDAAIARVKSDEPLSLEQAFVVEVWRAPIDQWRFAYNYGLPLAEVKGIVRWLLDEGILTHNRAGRREPEEETPQ